MARVITKDDVQAAADKAADKAKAAEMKRCVAAVKGIMPEAGAKPKAFIALAVAAIKTTVEA